ncbi:MAG: adenylosuccinate synthase [Cytophagales bacterium]|nr:adenylosuccinate synthase [Cytophagales bacterium]
MSAVDILLGLQWGDEGKGKVVDYLAPKYEVVARFQGGPNAGHTLEFDGHKHVLHQIPSGIFHEQILNVVGNGVVLDPITFGKELEKLEPFNIDIQNQLILSTKAQVILPTHRLLDQAYEKAKGKSKIGSTLRGIGPTYQDKMARVGLRVGDLLEKDFKARYEKIRERHIRILEQYGFEYDLTDAEEEFWKYVEVMAGLQIRNTEYLLNEMLTQGKSVLAEGAQGSLLDVDFGSYPFVTSSNTISAGACTGLGIPPHKIGEVFGIFKAYCTRVGSGPFPTELHDKAGEDLRKKGNEFGATTGRPRRCGWLDLPALKYATMINGVSQLFMMKVDVLSDLEELKVCTGYKNNGEAISEVPLYYNEEDWELVLKDFKSWTEEGQTGDFSQFSTELADYINFIENATGVPINLVSVGPDRKQTITRA